MTDVWTDGTLRFSYLEVAEIDQVAAMLAKPAVCEHVYFGPNTTEETRGYFAPMVEPMREALDRGERPDLHIFAIREVATGDFAGECALLPVMFGDGNYVIGYQLDEPYWRRGYGTRACEFLVWFGFTELGARRLSGDTLASNAGSIKVMERCGFTREGTQRGYYLARGAVRDNVLFGLLRDEPAIDLAELGARFEP